MTTTETANMISRRPSWAASVRINQDAIDYTWTAPTVPESIDNYAGATSPQPVDVTREDVLYINNEGVVVAEGPERIFLLDTTFDVENARKLITALTECCDRLDGTSAMADTDGEQ